MVKWILAFSFLVALGICAFIWQISEEELF